MAVATGSVADFHHHYNRALLSYLLKEEISLILIVRDVITGCSGGHVKCIAVKGKISTAAFQSLERRAYYRIYSF